MRISNRLKVFLPIALCLSLAACGGSSDSDSGAGDTTSGTASGGDTAGGTTSGEGATSGETGGGTTAGDGATSGETGGGTTAGDGATSGETGGGTTAGDGATSGETGGETGGETTAGDGATAGETGGGTTGSDGATGGETSGGTTAGDGAAGGETTGGETAGGENTGGENTGGENTGGTIDDGQNARDPNSLESLSQVDLPRYLQLIENVRAVEDEGEFTNDTYAAAIAAIAESTEAQLVFDHLEFLTLLERQILADESPLDFLNINEGSFNRVHLCPDGGRLLARKTDDSDSSDLTGQFNFEECEIGELFIDGSYTSRTALAFGSRRVTDASFSRLRIIGSDGASTTLSGSVRNDIQITDDTVGGDVFTSQTAVNVNADLAVPEGVVVRMQSFVSSTERAAAEDVTVLDSLPAQTYIVSFRGVSVSIVDDTNVSLSATTSTELARAPEGNTFEQGEIDFTLSTRSNRLTVQAANGDPDTFDAYILQQDNSVISNVVSWSSGDYEFGPRGRRMPLSLEPLDQ